MTDREGSNAYNGLAVVELMGHRKIAGHVREVRQFGTDMLEVSIPKPESEELAVTQYYGGQSIYCITPCDREVVDRVMRDHWATPEIVRLALPPASYPHEDDEE